MTEVKKTVAETIEESVAQFKESLKGYAKAEDMVKSLEDFKKAMKEEMDTKELNDKLTELKGVVERQAIILEGERTGAKAEVTFFKTVEHFVSEKSVSILNGKSEGLNVKTAVVRSAISDDPTAMMAAGVNQVATKKLGLWDMFKKVQLSPDSHGNYGYFDQIIDTRAAAPVGEEGTYPESAISWEYLSINLKKIGDTIPFSYESMKDVVWMESELNNFININIENVVETNLLVGSGIGDETKGWNEYATLFTDAMAANYKVKNPNTWDLAKAIKSKINSGKESKYDANLVTMSHNDFYKATGIKDDDGRYLIPPFVAQDGSNCAGMVVYACSDQEDDTMTVGDSLQASLIHDGVTELTLGESGTDFLKDKKTLKGRRRMALLVKNVDATSVYKVASITETLAAMNKSV